MILNFSRMMGFALALGAAFPAAAQVSDNRVSAERDWSGFVEQDPTECYAVSAPKQSTLTDANGRPTEGRRGDILLFVFYRPEVGVRGQVAFLGGYPFASGSTVDLIIGDTNFQLFTDGGEFAWPASPEEDARIVAAMKRGTEAIVKGRSGRGNITTDTFSLLGFSSQLAEAERRCAG